LKGKLAIIRQEEDMTTKMGIINNLGRMEKKMSPCLIGQSTHLVRVRSGIPDLRDPYLHHPHYPNFQHETLILTS